MSNKDSEDPGWWLPHLFAGIGGFFFGAYIVLRAGHGDVDGTTVLLGGLVFAIVFVVLTISRRSGRGGGFY